MEAADLQDTPSPASLTFAQQSAPHPIIRYQRYFNSEYLSDVNIVYGPHGGHCFNGHHIILDTRTGKLVDSIVSVPNVRPTLTLIDLDAKTALNMLRWIYGMPIPQPDLAVEDIKFQHLFDVLLLHEAAEKYDVFGLKEETHRRFDHLLGVYIDRANDASKSPVCHTGQIINKVYEIAGNRRGGIENHHPLLRSLLRIAVMRDPFFTLWNNRGTFHADASFSRALYGYIRGDQRFSQDLLLFFFGKGRRFGERLALVKEVKCPVCLKTFECPPVEGGVGCCLICGGFIADWEGATVKDR